MLGTALAAGGTVIARPMIGRADAKSVLIAEPVHGMGYLPLYVGMAKNLFDDVTVNIVTIESGGGHTNAVLSGQAFAFIGGPEHDAYAKAKGAELRSVVNCVDRGNVYFCAAKGSEPTNTDWAAYFKGKAIACGPYGGTPNSITRYLLKKWNLDAKTDVTLVETGQLGDHAGGEKQPGSDRHADRAVHHPRHSRRRLGRTVLQYSEGTRPLCLFDLQCTARTVQKEPELVRSFVRGMMKALKFVDANKDETAEIAKKQFPTMSLDDLKATLDRSFGDNLWSKDGMVSRASWDTAKAVVMGAGLLKTDVSTTTSST